MYLKQFAVILTLAVKFTYGYKYSILYEWSQIEYEFSTNEERKQAIFNGTFDGEKIQPIDVQYTFVKDAVNPERIFITTPRFEKTGTPAVLSVVTDAVVNGNPVVKPYPSWSWQINPENCNDHRIVSVFRVWMDECNRLWVIDMGVVGGEFVCNPQVLAFDLLTDKLLYKYEIPYDQYNNKAGFISPIVEVEDLSDRCKNTWVYVADPATPSLLVYSLAQNKSWVVQDSSFEASANWSTYDIAGSTFSVQDGILTVALSPASDGNKRKLRYHAMSNINESYVYTKDLKNPSNFEVPNPNLFQTYKGQRNQQSCVEATDSKGNLYFSLLIDVQLAKWNPKTEYKQENFEIIGDDEETMQFPSGLKVGRYQGGEALWVFSTSFQRFAAGTRNTSEINFRVLFTELQKKKPTLVYKFSILYEWSQIEYEFSSNEERTQAILNGSFDAANIQAIDVQYTFVKDAVNPERIFITTPRMAGPGTPATLSVVTDAVMNGNPIVKPYPSWSWHINLENCNEDRLVSVFRVWADECNRLWVMDTGISGGEFVCNPQLLTFDLLTDKLLYKYEIPYDQYQNTSLFVSPIAEVDDLSDCCKNTWVYVADPTRPSLLVYSLAQNKSWAIQDSSFEASANWTTFNIAGSTLSIHDGILTVALSPASDGPKRKLRYHAMSNINESYVYTRDLKNANNFEVPNPNLFHTYKGQRNQQSCVEATDSKGNLYFSLLTDVELAKWNPRTEYKQENFEIIGDDEETMQFPTGLKVGPYQGGEALWVFSTTSQRLATGTRNTSEINFIILFTELQKKKLNILV